jgi:hypothetical protein
MNSLSTPYKVHAQLIVSFFMQLLYCLTLPPLKMETVGSPDKFTWLYNPQDQHRHLHRRDNLNIMHRNYIYLLNNILLISVFENLTAISNHTNSGELLFTDIESYALEAVSVKLYINK